RWEARSVAPPATSRAWMTSWPLGAIFPLGAVGQDRLRPPGAPREEPMEAAKRHFAARKRRNLGDNATEGRLQHHCDGGLVGAAGRSQTAAAAGGRHANNNPSGLTARSGPCNYDAVHYFPSVKE